MTVSYHDTTTIFYVCTKNLQHLWHRHSKVSLVFFQDHQMMAKHYPNFKFTGFEINEHAYNIACRVLSVLNLKNVTLRLLNAFKYEFESNQIVTISSVVYK